MVLMLPTDLKTRRNYLFRELYIAKTRLARSLAANRPQDTQDNKIRLIRLLLELHESPELGPKRPFKLGHRLELVLQLSGDPKLTLSEAKDAAKSWYTFAKLLENSLEPVSFRTPESSPQVP